MKKGKRKFIRGQVWHWNDPIYKEKAFGKKVNKMEGTMRYSRYVLIIQADDSDYNDNILVVPCSSTQKYPGDIQIRIPTGETKSYVRPEYMMPVNKSSLNKCVCQVNYATMHKIDAAVASLLFPGGNLLANVKSKKRLSSIFNSYKIYNDHKSKKNRYRSNEKMKRH